LKIDVFTLFPEWFDWFYEQRHVRNALETGNELRLVNYRDTTPLSGNQVDDAPYGGGAGMILRVDVVDAALSAAYADDREPSRVLVLSPSGRQLDDDLASELAGEPHVALLSTRYEGIDERVRERLADEAVSIGPYVLSGGEPAAMVVADAVLRKLPGTLGDEHSAVEESFSEALDGGVEYPHYTRPASYRGWDVPDVLLSGHHAEVERWRLEQARSRSAASQPAPGPSRGPGRVR
jgi:tRNA (guanine37-N1)-methyltransferase